MFDFVPMSLYTSVFYHAMFVIMCLIVVLSVSYNLGDYQSVTLSSFLGNLMLGLVILYMGLRPISGYYFGDMGTYDIIFKKVQMGEDVQFKGDYVFNYFLYFSAKIMSSRMFFLLIDIIYIIPCYLFAKKYSGTYWMYTFFMFVGSFSFWAYGTNGLRNGMATSIFLLALYFYDKKIISYIIMVVSVGVHQSLIIPSAAFIVAMFYKDPKFYLYVWLAAIPLSLIGGSFWGTFFSTLGFGDQRAAGYLSGADTVLNKSEEAEFSSTGFRWDFVFYSSFAVLAGWYFIFKKNIKDTFYTHLFGTYVIANAFWILVIRANYSNRFAYLSWFLMAAVIAYPLFRYKIFNDQFKVAGAMLAGYFLFTYIMYMK